MKKNERPPTTLNLPTIAVIPARGEDKLRTAEPILPAQFFTPAHESHINWTGERLLMFAVLQDAVHSYYRYAESKTHRGKRLFAETCRWFWSQEQEYLYSFECICLHLHLDPNYIRRRLQRCCQSLALPPRVSRSTDRRRASSGSQVTALAA